MTYLNVITDAPKQEHTFVLPDGRKVDFLLEHRENQSGWFYSVSVDTPSGRWRAENRRLVTHPNMLRAFSRIIRFGLACVTEDNNEPIFISDFVIGRASLYLLDETDISSVEEIIRTYEV